MSKKLPFKTAKLNLSKEKDKSFIEIQQPTIVYKKVRIKNYTPIIATLLLPEGTILYTSEQGFRRRKLRASQAIVLELRTMRSNRLLQTAKSEWDNSFRYRVDEFVFPKKPFCRKKQECASGIHCFATEAEARKW